MKELIIILSQNDKESLGTVRCLPNLRVAVHTDQLWVRGIAGEKIQLPLKQLPALQTFQLDERNYLFPVEGLTPIGKLPELTWMPVSAFIQPELPTSALPGKVTQQHPVKLVPSERVAEGGALVTDLALWKEYAEKAPAIRLAQLQFAVSEDNQVLILGSPLPPIPGKEYWLRNHILLPNGHDFEWSLVADLLSAQLNPQKDSILVFHTDGSWEQITRTNFVPATRSAVRLTKGKETYD